MTQNQADQLKEKNWSAVKELRDRNRSDTAASYSSHIPEIPYKSYLKEKQAPIADANTDRRSKESGTFNKLKVTYGYLCLASHNIRTRE
jgi:hypothetical protein